MIILKNDKQRIVSLHKSFILHGCYHLEKYDFDDRLHWNYNFKKGQTEKSSHPSELSAYRI